jgi:RNase P/RNase MRP subunit p30
MFLDFLIELREEEAREAVRLLKELGFKGGCFFGTKPKGKLKLVEGVKIEPKNVRELRNAIKGIERDKFLLLKHRGDSLTRYAVERSLVDGIVGLETDPRRDLLHHRRSGLDQTLARFASKHKVSILFNFNLILNSKGIWRAVILGRMAQNARICKKYEVPIMLVSGAKKLDELRTPGELISFGRLLGLGYPEAKGALHLAQEEIIRRIELAKEGQILPGIRVIRC